MEALAFLLLLIIALCFVVPLIAIAKAAAARRSVENFETRLRSLEAELQMLRRTPADSATEQPFGAKTEAPEPERFVSPPVAQPSELQPTPAPPPFPEEVITPAASVPPAPPQPPAGGAPASQPLLLAINWEQFMGAKLFAWIGGTPVFLGVAVFLT